MNRRRFISGLMALFSAPFVPKIGQEKKIVYWAGTRIPIKLEDAFNNVDEMRHAIINLHIDELSKNLHKPIRPFRTMDINDIKIYRYNSKGQVYLEDTKGNINV